MPEPKPCTCESQPFDVRCYCTCADPYLKIVISTDEYIFWEMEQA